MADTTTAHSPILWATGLTREFGGFVAVKDVSLAIMPGQIHALIGPNGAGKTTLFNLLTGFLKPTRGRIEYLGDDISHVAPQIRARSGLVRSFQISATFGNLSVHENVRVALQRKAGLAVQFWRSDAILRRLDDRVREFVDMVNLTAYASKLASELSYGRRRMLEIATTLAMDPKVLLLDEPIAGVSHEDIPHVVALLRKVAEGRTLVMVEHNLPVVRDLCDRISVLQRGEIIAEGDYATVAASQLVREAYIGRDANV